MKWIGPILTVLGLGAMVAFGTWAFEAAGASGNGWDGLKPIMPYVIGGMVAVGALTGVLMWLAFYSSRKGYDEPFNLDEPEG